MSTDTSRQAIKIGPMYTYTWWHYIGPMCSQGAKTLSIFILCREVFVVCLLVTGGSSGTKGKMLDFSHLRLYRGVIIQKSQKTELVYFYPQLKLHIFVDIFLSK